MDLNKPKYYKFCIIDTDDNLNTQCHFICDRHNIIHDIKPTLECAIRKDYKEYKYQWEDITNEVQVLDDGPDCGFFTLRHNGFDTTYISYVIGKRDIIKKYYNTKIEGLGLREVNEYELVELSEHQLEHIHQFNITFRELIQRISLITQEMNQYMERIRQLQMELSQAKDQLANSKASINHIFIHHDE